MFEHEIWRTYFTACATVGQSTWATPAALTQWAATTVVADLISILPFAMGMLKDRPRQRALVDALLDRDVELYFRALRTRPVADGFDRMNEYDRTLYVLTELHSGYVNLVERYVPRLRPLLEPWTQGDGGEEARGEKPVVAGTLQPRLRGHADHGVRPRLRQAHHPVRLLTVSNLSYSWGFAPNNTPIAIVEHLGVGDRPRHAPTRGVSRHGTTLGGHLRVDSARLISARSLMDQLRTLCKEGQLPPVAWLARERFKTMVKQLGFSGFLEGDWHTRDVQWHVSWARQRVGSAEETAFMVGRDLIPARAFVDIGEQLIRDGNGGTAVWDLGLPGPDNSTNGGFFSRSYSPARKLERVRAAYRAIVETYKSLCEQYFGRLTPQMFYAQCPARPVVRLMADTQYAPTGLHVWWQLVDTWEEAAQPDVALAQGSPNWDALADAMRADCARLRRPFHSLTFSTGRFDWAPWDEGVTNKVRQLLTKDMERIGSLLESAS